MTAPPDAGQPDLNNPVEWPTASPGSTA